MSDDTPGKPAANEPSMEDILASIRRILAEDTGEEEGKDAPAQPLTSSLFDEIEAGAPPPPKPAPPAFDDDPEDEPEDEPGGAPGDTPAAAFPPRPPAADVFVLTPGMRVEAEPPMPNETRLVAPPPVTRGAAAAPGEQRRVVSTPAADVSADVLSHLAKAILDRRDIAIGARDVTLEGMVREMLRPMLREWLDRNLPYLIERLVKKEIDLMVNRAERLDD